MIDGWKEERPSKNRNIFCKHKGTLCLRAAWLQHLYVLTSLLYCKGKEYQDSGIKPNPARVESSTVPPKLPKKWAAAAASRYPVMVAATCKYLEQDCTMIVQ